MKVLIADFLEEASIEAPILEDLARVVVVKCHREPDLLPELDGADALILFHDIQQVGDATFCWQRVARS